MAQYSPNSPSRLIWHYANALIPSYALWMPHMRLYAHSRGGWAFRSTWIAWKAGYRITSMRIPVSLDSGSLDAMEKS